VHPAGNVFRRGYFIPGVFFLGNYMYLVRFRDLADYSVFSSGTGPEVYVQGIDLGLFFIGNDLDKIPFNIDMRLLRQKDLVPTVAFSYDLYGIALFSFTQAGEVDVIPCPDIRAVILYESYPGYILIALLSKAHSGNQKREHYDKRQGNYL
jgi:hypothetical protein